MEEGPSRGDSPGSELPASIYQNYTGTPPRRCLSRSVSALTCASSSSKGRVVHNVHVQGLAGVVIRIRLACDTDYTVSAIPLSG